MSKRRIDFNPTRKKLRKRKTFSEPILLCFFVALVYGVIVLRANYKTVKLIITGHQPKNRNYKIGNFVPKKHETIPNYYEQKMPISTILNKEPNLIQKSDSKAISYIIRNVSEPIDHRALGYPIGACIKDTATELLYIFEKHSASKIVKVFSELENSTMMTSHVIPYMWGGTGHVVLDGTIYFNKYNTSTIVKYNIQSQKILVEKDFNDAGWGNRCSYKLLGSTDFDFAVDETGLWIVYGTHETCNLTISKLDFSTLEVTKTWHTKILKSVVGNSFIANGVLYTIKTHEGYKNLINYAFDTTRSEYFSPNIPILNRHGYVSMLDYNFKEKKLYAWDRGHLMTYYVFYL